MLELQGVSKAYAGEPALQDVSFRIEPGEIVALLGANGSGKTTTVQSICRLIEWDSGDIFFNQKPTCNSTDYFRHIGAVLGGCRNTNWRLSASANARYFAQVRGFKGSEVLATIARLHTQLGLDEHAQKEVMKLSTGNKQKAALLSALGYSPDLVLLDEPTLGLDFTTVNELQAIIQSQAREQQQSFLITSHDLSFIENICTRALVLDHGRLLFAGDIAELKAQMFSYELKLTPISAAQVESISSLWQGRYHFSSDEQLLAIQFESPAQCLPTMAYLNEQNIAPELCTIKALSVEQAYQHLVAEERA